jgi:CHRD domain
VKRFTVVTSAAVGCVLALLAAGAAIARPEATSIRLSTTMNAAQEVPAPKGNVSGARGTFTATVTKSGSGAALSWNMTFAELTGPAGAAHVHSGETGVAGPVTVPLCGPCQSPASGTANVDASVVASLQSGGAYVNVHTATNGPGEIRGQLAVTANVRTTLSSRQEVPRPTGAVGRATGTFTGTVTRGEETTLNWRLTFARLTGRATAAHIHVARRGRAGPVAVALCGPCRSGVRRTVTLQRSVITALEAGRAYVNVHTARNPAGEIRGQIAPVPLTIS